MYGIGPVELMVFAVLVVWIWILFDILKSEFKEPTNKIIWLLVVLLIPLLSWVLYFLIGRKQKVPANAKY